MSIMSWWNSEVIRLREENKDLKEEFKSLQRDWSDLFKINAVQTTEMNDLKKEISDLRQREAIRIEMGAKSYRPRPKLGRPLGSKKEKSNDIFEQIKDKK
jgi:hypothetical protein